MKLCIYTHITSLITEISQVTEVIKHVILVSLDTMDVHVEVVPIPHGSSIFHTFFFTKVLLKRDVFGIMNGEPKIMIAITKFLVNRSDGSVVSVETKYFYFCFGRMQPTTLLFDYHGKPRGVFFFFFSYGRTSSSRMFRCCEQNSCP